LGEQAVGASRKMILFVSSKGLDTAGAKNFGYTIAWIDRTGSPFKGLEVRPDVEVLSLAALSGWLRERDPSKHR
jgi:2-haloacid dehalogenase